MTTLTNTLHYSNLRHSVLEVLSAGKTGTITDIAGSLRVLRPSVSRCVADLTESGLVERKGRQMSLTAQGRTCLEEFERRQARQRYTEQLERLLHETQCVMNSLVDEHHDAELRETTRKLNERIAKIQELQP